VFFVGKTLSLAKKCFAQLIIGNLVFFKAK
jgi:hypothetical protein